MSEKEFRRKLSVLLWHPPKATYVSSNGGTYEDADYFQLEHDVLTLLKEAGWIDPSTLEDN